jgi:Sec-independent protein translocase protein TatA
MNFLNLGLPEILFIVIIALIIFGPNQMVKSAKDVGTFLRKAAKSPYWKEVWATKRDIDELPKMLAKEARLSDTIHELDRDSKKIDRSVSTAVKDLIMEVESPVQEIKKPGINEVQSKETGTKVNP